MRSFARETLQMSAQAIQPHYPPITPELRDAILAAFADFTPAGDHQ